MQYYPKVDAHKFSSEAGMRGRHHHTQFINVSHLKPSHMTPPSGRVAHSLLRLPMSMTRCIARYQTLEFSSTTGLTDRKKRRITDLEISGRKSRETSQFVTLACGGDKSGKIFFSFCSNVARSGRGMRKATERFRRPQVSMVDTTSLDSSTNRALS